jgi:hypothetical protein
MLITIVGRQNGKRTIIWSRAFLALAWLNTVMELVAFGLFFKEHRSIGEALPFVCAFGLALSILAVGFLYWFSVPADRLPVLEDKTES